MPSSSHLASTAPSRRTASSSLPRPAAIMARPKTSLAWLDSTPVLSSLREPQPVLLGEGVVPPVLGAVGQVVSIIELLRERLCALELSGCQEQLTNTPVASTSGVRHDRGCARARGSARTARALATSPLPGRAQPSALRASSSRGGPRQRPEIDRLFQSAHPDRELSAHHVEVTEVHQRRAVTGPSSRADASASSSRCAPSANCDVASQNSPSAPAS